MSWMSSQMFGGSTVKGKYSKIRMIQLLYMNLYYLNHYNYMYTSYNLKIWVYGKDLIQPRPKMLVRREGKIRPMLPFIQRDPILVSPGISWDTTPAAGGFTPAGASLAAEDCCQTS